MLFAQANGTSRALALRHPRVQLRSELVEVDAVTFEHDEKMIHHIGRLVTQMVDGGCVLGRQLHRQDIALICAGHRKRGGKR